MPSPANGCYQAVRTIAALELLAVRPCSAPELAEVLQIQVRTARGIMRVLSAGGYIELLPDNPRRRRYRISQIGRLLGQRMALASTGCDRGDGGAGARSSDSNLY
jgi:DNA-binding IclR family transcriptional regulator